MAHTKVLTPTVSALSDLLGPLPTEDDFYYDVEDPTEAVTSAVLRARLEEAVLRTQPGLSLVLPPSLLDQIAQDVVLLAKDEPCGLRGCVMTVAWNDGDTYELLARVQADANTPTTHILHLTLRPDPTSWYTKMARIFRSLSKRRVVVSPKYDLTKGRLYNFEE